MSQFLITHGEASTLPTSPEGLFSVESDTHDSKLGRQQNEMKNGIKRGHESTNEERLPSIGELYRQQRPEMKAAESKEEAYDAIKPLVGLAGMYENLPLFEDLPVGGGILPERIATLTPLSPKEVEYAIVEASQEFAELANEDNGPEVNHIRK